MLEGFDILKSILNDLDKSSIFDISFIVNPGIDLNLDNCSRIELNGDIYKWLDRHCIEYDYCLFVAPEDNQIQHNITKILEKHDITLLNSGSHASFITSSKNRTYKKIPDSILKIPSQLTKLEDTKKVIEEHDFNFKVKNAKKFIEDGNKVKITVRFRGRELNYVKLGEQVLNNFSEALSEVATLEKKPLLEGKNMFIILAPLNK